VHKLTNFGVYAQSHLRLRNGQLRLTGNVRLDEHLVYGPQLTGRFAAVNSWNDDLVTKFIYSSAFKAPSPQLLYAVPLEPGGLVGNPDLKPQTVHTFEVNGSRKFLKYFNVQTGFAYSLLLDKAEFVPQGTNQTAKNIARVQALSWESRLDAVFRDSARGYLGLDWQHPMVEYGQPSYLTQLVAGTGTEAPAWVVRLGLSGRLPVRDLFTLQLNAEGRWVDRRRASDNNILEAGNVYYLSSYFDLGASVGVVNLFLVPGHETSINLRGVNLLDHRTADPGYAGVDYPQTGREIFLELRQQI
jgi:iron complex outermembrane receptor protein